MFPSLGTLDRQAASSGMSSFSRYRRKDSAIRTLVAETLVLAKTHGYVEKIENELEEELQQETEPPKENFGRWRRRGYNFFKSKVVLLTVVCLCIVDCALVLGELTLDLYKVKVTLDESDKITNSTKYFMSLMRYNHKAYLGDDTYDEVFEKIMAAQIIWNSSYELDIENIQLLRNSNNSGIHMRYKRGAGTQNPYVNPNITGAEYNKKYTSIEEIIAHAFHLASMSILGIMVVETILKVLCAGSTFFHRKLEVFDAFIVIVSFIVDATLIVVHPGYNTRDFVFILAFLLPWRVIRVVDSLVVAVKDHEHFRLKLVYSRKKKIQNNLRDMEVKAQIFQYQCNALRRLCIAEGLDEWKIDQCVKAEQKYQSTFGKRKCKLRIDSSTLSLINERDGLPPSRSPRPSLPTLDFHGLKFLNGHSLKHNESNGQLEDRVKDKTIS